MRRPRDRRDYVRFADACAWMHDFARRLSTSPASKVPDAYLKIVVEVRAWSPVKGEPFAIHAMKVGPRP